MGILGKIIIYYLKSNFSEKQIEALGMLGTGTNCIRNDELVPSQVSSYDIVYAHGVPENHLEHLWSYQHDVR